MALFEPYPYPDTKTDKRYCKKRKLLANICDEHRCKNPQTILPNRIKQYMKGPQIMIKWDLFQKCKGGSISANQQMCCIPHQQNEG